MAAQPAPEPRGGGGPRGVLAGAPDVGGYTPEGADQYLGNQLRADALYGLKTMRMVSRGRTAAWDAGRAYAEFLLTMAGAEFRASYAALVRMYNERRVRGRGVDTVVRALNRACAREALQQGRLARQSIPTAVHNPLVEGMK